MSDIADLLSTLGLKHPLERSTCIGYGQRKPDCGCAVAIASRSTAHNLLIEIKEKLKRKENITNSLYTLASLLLCKNWHQSQTAENVSRWELKLRNYRPSLRTQHATSTDSRFGDSTTFATPSRKISKEQALRQCSDGALLRELKRRVETEQHSDVASRIVRLAEELCPLDSDTDESTVDEYSIEEPSSDEDDEAEHASGRSFPLLLTYSPPEPLRQSHTECAICTEPYALNGGDHWQCSQCLNRAHQACFDLWYASQIDGGRSVRCIHCRAQA